MSFDPRPYIEGIKRANEAERKAVESRAGRAREEARRLADTIMSNDRDVEAIYLFGSLAKGTPARPDFDIDLAVAGGDIYRAMELVEDSEFKVDLVDFHRLPEHVQASIVESSIQLGQRS